MRWFPKLPSLKLQSWKLQSWKLQFWSGRKQELSEELESHLRMAVEDRIAEQRLRRERGDRRGRRRGVGRQRAAGEDGKTGGSEEGRKEEFHGRIRNSIRFHTEDTEFTEIDPVVFSVYSAYSV